MKDTDKELPECFGNLNIVFPKGTDGLRHTPDTCFICPEKTPCLKIAMAGKGGLKVKEEFTRRAYESGLIGFFERWSKKKELIQKLRKKGKKNTQL